MLAVKKSVMLLHCTCSYTLNAILPFSLLGESFNEGKFIMLELQLWLSYVQKREKKKHFSSGNNYILYNVKLSPCEGFSQTTTHK